MNEIQKDNKTIAVTLRFWTNNVKVAMKGKEIKAVCQDAGMMILEKNDEKGITYMAAPFNCPEDITPLLKELFRKNRIIVVSKSRRPRVLSHLRKSQ